MRKNQTKHKIGWVQYEVIRFQDDAVVIDSTDRRGAPCRMIGRLGETGDAEYLDAEGKSQTAESKKTIHVLGGTRLTSKVRQALAARIPAIPEEEK